MSFATPNTASVELCHARRGTANPTVHTEHALHPGSLFVGAGPGAERLRTDHVMGSVCRRLHSHECRGLVEGPAVATNGGGLRFLPSIPTND